MTSPATPLLQERLKPLRPWLDHDATEDIAIQIPGEAWIRMNGQWIYAQVPALDIDALEDIATLAGSLRKQETGAHAPLCATELPNGERLQICLPPAVGTGLISLSIRKREPCVAPLSKIKERYRTDGWNDWRVLKGGRDLTEPAALKRQGDLERFLAACVRARLNFLLAGATGDGKTTLSETILSSISHEERLIIIEDTKELTILQPNTVRMFYTKDDLSNTKIDADSLLQASLRMRPDRVILQELRDDAAWTYVNEICSGHPGSVTTIHGSSAADAIRRLFTLIKASPKGAALNDATLLQLISAAVHVIVPLDRPQHQVGIGSVWYIGDAIERGETAADLLRL
jgi:type IV secretion system protein VirB11